MDDQLPLDEPADDLEHLPQEERSKQVGVAKPKKPAAFNFWSGLTTVLGAAFIVATLFTLWTPGSLVESSLEARMAQVIDSVPGEGDSILVSAPDSEEDVNWETIGIVAGHYGSDPGAVCPNNVTEAELNLEIATLVQKRLTDMGYEVDLLQEFDSRLWGYQAAVVVSIHLDSCQYVNEQATGYKVASALSAQNIADSQRLTQCLSTRYGEVTGLPYHAGSVTNDMTYYHAFNEVDPRTLAAIIEAGFMNLDYRFITEETDLVAEGIVAGILCYLNNEPLSP
ncbi:MAG: N-acetylmuramoyl-L-alanine amidase [Brevefilum sp.]|nr:N-acetylmuramoyl-L-alanine amidase [Brevefilum sp.]